MAGFMMDDGVNVGVGNNCLHGCPIHEVHVVDLGGFLLSSATWRRDSSPEFIQVVDDHHIMAGFLQ